MPQAYIPNDKWSQKAKAEGYRARSVYKLIELDERFHLIKPGMTVLDLGAAPGSWTQYAAKKAARVIALDLTEIEPIEVDEEMSDTKGSARRSLPKDQKSHGRRRVECHVQDITDVDGVGSIVELSDQEISDSSEETHEKTGGIRRSPGGRRRMKEPVDLILSDLAPKTSGIKDVDQWRSIELNQAVEAIAKSFLRQGGTCVMKVFRGADFDDFLKGLKRNWKVKTAQVKASRDRSREIYLILQKQG